MFDDPEFGYPRFIGTKRWQPAALTEQVGDGWNFQRENLFKHYPHCRSQHGLLDLLGEILDDNGIRASEIEAIRAWGEGHVDRPIWLTNTIEQLVDAQFSIAHGMAVAAQRIPPGKAWQSADVVFDPAVLELMPKVTYAPHPDWATAIVADPTARPSRVEVDARGGRTFAAEHSHPRNTPGTAGGVKGMPDEELISKFRLNAADVLSANVVDTVVDAVMNLESVADVSVVLRSLGAE